MRLLLTSVTALLLCHPAFAADACDGGDLPQVTLNACAYQSWLRHHRQLNVAYAQAAVALRLRSSRRRGA